MRPFSVVRGKRWSSHWYDGASHTLVIKAIARVGADLCPTARPWVCSKYCPAHLKTEQLRHPFTSDISCSVLKPYKLIASRWSERSSEMASMSALMDKGLWRQRIPWRHPLQATYDVVGQGMHWCSGGGQEQFEIHVAYYPLFICLSSFPFSTYFTWTCLSTFSCILKGMWPFRILTIVTLDTEEEGENRQLSPRLPTDVPGHK